MAAPARGLSPSDLGQIRDTLAAGRKPKVMFTETAGQVAGTLGQVVQLADPATSDEWIVVRFGRDELPFSPTDLAMPGRAPAKAAAGKGRKEPEPAPKAPPLRLVEPPAPPPPPPVAPDPAPPKKAARPKPPASLTVTLSYTDREWTVAASMGARTLAKPYTIRPAEALRMVALVDMPSVTEAVESIIAAERTEAEDRAERLRTELAEIEARLAELNNPPAP